MPHFRSPVSPAATMAKSSDLLIIIPAPGLGHVVSAVELANTFLNHGNRFSIAILIISPLSDQDKFAKKLSSLDTRIALVNVPPVDPMPLSTGPPRPIEILASLYIEAHKVNVAKEVRKLINSAQLNSIRFVVDIFSTSMIDVANQVNAPSYIFFPSNAAFLGLCQFMLTRSTFALSDPSSIIPAYAHPIPTSVLPSFAFSEDAYDTMSGHIRRFNETKGIIVNTVSALEPHALDSFSGKTPPVYPIGPLLNLGESKGAERDRILKWLDEQEEESVVFLCFGSFGSFGPDQVKEIAAGLEKSGVKFLWALRKPAAAGGLAGPSDFTDHREVLPEGFLSRIRHRGLVCGWAPQIEILAHNAVGGFVSHCGWNSILEALWLGVPIATWPLYAEQKANAFYMLKDLNLAIELSTNYRLGQGEVVPASEIESGLIRLMEPGGEVRKRVREMSESIRAATTEGGSSFEAIRRLVEDMLS